MTPDRDFQYLVTFMFKDDSHVMFDSVWSTWQDANKRVGVLNSMKSAIIDGINFEPVVFNTPGWSAEELEE